VIALTPLGEYVYDQLAPFASTDEVADWPLATFVDAIAAPIQAIDDIARPATGTPWGWMFDPAICPPTWFQWIAQFSGPPITEGITEQAARDELAAHSGWTRGTVDGITAQIKSRLSGAQWVAIYERYQGDPYSIAIRVRVSELTLPTAEMALFVKSLIPAGLTLDYNYVAGATFDSANTAFTTFDAENAAFATFDAAAAG
jgi:hypothetical protein